MLLSIYLVFLNECDYYILWYSHSVHPEKWHALKNVNACENRIRANGKQCMMQMPVRTAEQIYCGYSHLLLQRICDSVLWYDSVFIVKRPCLYYFWYSRHVYPEKWHASHDVKCLWNCYPGKWQAMHDSNACEQFHHDYTDILGCQ